MILITVQVEGAFTEHFHQKLYAYNGAEHLMEEALDALALHLNSIPQGTSYRSYTIVGINCLPISLPDRKAAAFGIYKLTDVTPGS